jgi:hypothetical protein
MFWNIVPEIQLILINSVLFVSAEGSLHVIIMTASKQPAIQ